MLLWLFIILFLTAQACVCWIFFAAGKRRMDQSRILWALAIAARDRLPMADEIDAVAYGLSNRQKERAYALAERLRSGLTLPEALERSPGVIPRSAMLEITIGQRNGRLAETLHDTAVRHANYGQRALTGRPSTAIGIYYAVVFPVFAMGVITFLVYFVMPRFRKIFHDFGSQLPTISRNFILISDFVSRNLLLFLPVIVLIGAAIVWSVSRYISGWGEGDIPIVGRWFRRFDVPGILRNLATTAAAEGRIDESLATLAVNHHRRSVRSALESATEMCRRGDDCWYALRDVGLLTRHEVAVLRSATRVGNLAWALRQLADTIERRTSYRWQSLTEFVTPLLIVAIGLLTAFVYLAFFYPLLHLIESLS